MSANQAIGHYTKLAQIPIRPLARTLASDSLVVGHRAPRVSVSFSNVIGD
jgi:hypothetical protein